MNDERRRRLLQIGSAAIFVAVVVVAVLIVVSSNETDGGDTSLEDVGLVKRQLRGIPQTGLTLGDPTAKVTLFEYGDLQCPVCKAFSEQIVPQVIESKVRTGEAKLEFRNFTIISEESVPAGAAALAAGQQGRGWNYVELFYRNQGREASGYVTDEFLTELARGAGVADLDRWNK
ncbi:MAG TPA: thioredoxin domain-containing protein, partial [Solirubrobacterales bacterium]|nr:thioredoxin domain-containing protein [Solirubrobacterales bacterium]